MGEKNLESRDDHRTRGEGGTLHVGKRNNRPKAKSKKHLLTQNPPRKLKGKRGRWNSKRNQGGKRGTPSATKSE